jgi:3-dehydroquinate dehydratase/shikimate dehydrogenase
MALLFKDKICAVIAASTAREIQAQLRQALKLTRTVELRLDYLRGGAQIEEMLHWLRDRRIPADLVATARRISAGGRLRGELSLQMAVLAMFATYHGGWCDTEIETCESQPGEVLRLFLKRTRCIISFHDFQRVPRALLGIVTRLGQFCKEDEAIKIATQCNSYGDALRVLALCKGRSNVIAVPMGEIGLPARVLALAHGSALAYAAVGERTAPGQLTLDEMKSLYRADKLDRKTKVYGVIGNPVSHSLSPLMHNTGFIARKLNAVYLPFLVKDLRDFLGAVKPLNVAGFSVTLPWKERILPHLDDCDPLAEKIGAVNTVVVRRNGKLYGCNTDYVGVLRALERRVRLRGSRVLLYGAGGVARAVAFALAQGGAIVCVCSRRPEQARQLARAVGGVVVERLCLRREFFDAIVNCTPVGMHPRTNASPLRAEELNCRLVFDTVYRPMRTRLLQLAERRGIETVSGVEMFIAQGVAQWEIWTESRAPETAMRKMVLAALRKEHV